MTDCQYCDMDNDRHDKHCPGVEIERLTAEVSALRKHLELIALCKDVPIDIAKNIHITLTRTASGSPTQKATKGGLTFHSDGSVTKHGDVPMPESDWLVPTADSKVLEQITNVQQLAENIGKVFDEDVQMDGESMDAEDACESICPKCSDPRLEGSDFCYEHTEET